jgi:quercetin dioxygenase-like cupin family protein
MKAVFYVFKPSHVPQDNPINIFDETLANKYYRRVVETIPGQVQTVVMNIPPGGTIPKEMHPDTTQSIVVVKGIMKITIDGRVQRGHTGTIATVPKGSTHEVINASCDNPLKLYTHYWPPKHPPDLVQPKFIK